MQRAMSRAASVFSGQVNGLAVDDRIALRHLAAAALATHGLLHVMGSTLLWRSTGPADARWSAALTPAPGSAPGIAVGAAWLLAGALFVSAAVLLARSRQWRPTATAAVAVSTVALLPFSEAALYGLLVDGAVVVAILVTRRGAPMPPQDRRAS